MANSLVPTKANLLAALKQNGDDAVRRLRALPEATFDEGRYENGWNGRQILAHIASIEWTYPRLIELARGAERPWASQEGGRKVATARGGIDSYNERQVELRAAAPVAELIDEFERNRAALVAALEAADESLLTVAIRSAGGVSAEMGQVLNAVAVAHVIAHVDDIAGTPQPD